MPSATNDPSVSAGHLPGDKVRLRTGPHQGKRGVVKLISQGELEVGLESGGRIKVAADGVTNFSLAARKAWQKMPKRAGRPKGGGAKKMASFRLDQDVVEMLTEAKRSGQIENTNDAVNSWLRERLGALLGTPSSPPPLKD